MLIGRGTLRDQVNMLLRALIVAATAVIFAAPLKWRTGFKELIIKQVTSLIYISINNGLEVKPSHNRQ